VPSPAISRQSGDMTISGSDMPFLHTSVRV
jgi:hypothetical protein